MGKNCLNKIRITNQVLATKIDSIKETLDEIKPEIKKNTEFRQKANGIMLFLSSVAAVIGGGIAFIIDKLFGGKP